MAGVKPNFIIAMYCLSILLIRPSFLNAAIIGLLSGAICQLFPGTPYLNFASELVGALVMYFLLCIPVNIGFGKLDLKPIVTTFLSTLASGFTFIAILNLAFLSGANVKTPVFAAFLVIIFGTATINSILVQALYLPLKAALVKDRK